MGRVKLEMKEKCRSMGVENTVVAGIRRRRHLSSKVFYRYKSASREIVCHRKSVSKLILLLSPIKCHFALQCFLSSVILKRISIQITATTNCHNVLCADGNGRKYLLCHCICSCIGRHNSSSSNKNNNIWDKKKKTSKSQHSIVRCVNECVRAFVSVHWAMLSLSLFFRRCRLTNISRAIKDQTIYQSELASIHTFSHLSFQDGECNGPATYTICLVQVIFLLKKKRETEKKTHIHSYTYTTLELCARVNTST